MNIVLIGFMGCGKTTVGKKLAASLGRVFVDTDELVCRRAGMAVSDIFERHGEAAFRGLECEAVAEACAMGRAVIATGGGAVMNRENVRLLRQRGVVVYLRATAERICENTRNDTSRPLLKNGGARAVHRLLSGREPLYESCRHIAVDVGAKPPEDIVSEIIRAMNARADFA